MKEHKKNNKGIFVTLSIAAAMIVLGAVLMNTLLAHAAKPDENIVRTEPVSQTLNTDEAAPMPEDLTVIVYENGLIPPPDGVTAQYAVAAVSEIAERVYGKKLAGRVFVFPGYSSGADKSLYWNVTAQVEGGSIDCTIDVESGVDIMTNLNTTLSDWNWFDTWDEEAAEQGRQEDERVLQETQERDEQILAEQPQPTEEQIAAGLAEKRQDTQDFMASVADKPHGAKAVELVNTLGIGDGANAVSGVIIMEGGGAAPEGEIPIETYEVEMALDNGKFLRLSMEKETMVLFGYSRYDESYLTSLSA